MKLVIKNNKDIIVDKKVDYTEEYNIVNIKYDKSLLIINKNKSIVEKIEEDSNIFIDFKLKKGIITLTKENISFDLDIINTLFTYNEDSIIIEYSIPQSDDESDYMTIHIDVIY